MNIVSRKILCNISNFPRSRAYRPILALGLCATVAGCGNSEVASPPAPPESIITEANFSASLASETVSEDQRREWQAARNDHRLIVGAILACKGLLPHLGGMPPQMFSALLLDLTPLGSHHLGSSAASHTNNAARPEPPEAPAREATSPGSGARKIPSAKSEPEAEHVFVSDPASPPPSIDPGKSDAAPQHADDFADQLSLTPEEWNLLEYSDSIARARILAAWQREQALIPAGYLWYATLLVSGLATLFVTLQTKMERPPDEAQYTGASTGRGSGTTPKPGSADGVEGEGEVQQTAPSQRLGSSSAWWWLGWKWRVWRFHMVAFLAIALSIAGTSLTSLKQYFDPTRAVVENERAALGLRSLHEDVVLAANSCNADSKSIKFEGNKEWPGKMQVYMAEIISPYSPNGSENEVARSK